MWGHTLSLSDSLRCVILKSHQPTRLPPQCNIQLLSVHRTPSAAHYWTNMSPPDIIRSAIFISWTDFLRTWIQSGEDPLNGQLWGFVIFIITSYVHIFDWNGWLACVICQKYISSWVYCMCKVTEWVGKRVMDTFSRREKGIYPYIHYIAPPVSITLIIQPIA